MLRSPDFANLRIRLILLVLITIVPMAGLIGYANLEERRHVLFDIEQNARRATRLAAARQSDLLDSTHQLLMALAQLPAVRDADAESCSALVSRLLAQYPRFANLRVSRPNGDVFCSAVPVLDPVNVANDLYFQSALQHRDLSIGNFQIGPISNKPIIGVGYPVLGDTGDVEAVLVATLDLAWLKQVIAESNIPSQAALMLVDRQGTVLAHYPDGPRSVGQSISNQALLKTIVAQHQGAAEDLEADGSLHLYVFAPWQDSAEPNAFILMDVSEAPALAEANGRLARNLLLGLITVVVLAAGWFGGEVFVRRRELEHAQAEQALKQSEERYRDLFENANDLIQCVTPEGRFVYTNRAWRNALGYTEAEIAHLSLFDIIAPDCQAHCLEVFRRIMAGENVERTETRFLAKSGQTIVVEGSINCKFENGQPVSTRGIFRDITARKQAEQELLHLNAHDALTALYNRRYFVEAQSRLQSENHLPASIVIVDVDGLKSINDRLGHAAGDKLLQATAALLRTSFRSQDIIARIGGDEFAVLLPATNELVAAAAAERVRYNVRVHNAARTGLWLSLSLGVATATNAEELTRAFREADERMYLDKASKPSRALPTATFADLADRQRAEQALEQVTYENQLILDSAAEGILGIDLHGRHTFINRAAARMLGYAIGDLVGQRSHATWHHSKVDGRRYPPEECPIYATCRDGLARQINTEVFWRKDGTCFPVEYTSTPIQQNHQVIGAVVTFRDITERQRAEQVLRQSEAQFRYLFQCNPQPMWVYDLQTLRFLEVNDAAVARYGYSRDEFLQLDLTGIRPLEDVPRLLEDVRKDRPVLECSEGWRHRFKDGRIIDVQITSHSLEYEGRPAVLVIAEDITERKRAQAREADQRALAEALCDTAAALNGTLDFDEVLDRILDNVGRVVPHDTASILLVESDVARIVRCRGYAERGLADWALRQRFQLDEMAGMSKMIETGQPFVIPDTAAAARWVSFAETRWIRSYVGAPIRIKGQVIGLLTLDSAIPNFFTPALAARLQAFADQAAIALENARLLDETRQRLAELEAVNRISTGLRAAHTLDEMLPLFLDETLAVLGTNAGVLWLFEQNRKELYPAVARGWFSQVRLHLSALEGTGAPVAGKGQTLIAREFKTDPTTREAARAQIPAGWGGACVPVRTAEEIIGALFVSVPLPRELKPGEVRLLTTLAEMVGGAIQRTRLAEETERRMQQLLALRQIDATITASADLDLALQVLLDQVTTQLRVDAATILLLEPATQSLTFAAERGFRSKAITRARLRVGEGLAGRAVQERRIINVANLPESPELLVHSPLLSGEEFVAFFAVPLIAKSQIQGVLNIFHRSPLDPNPEWLEFLEILAGQAAIAIDNATLFKDLQHSNQNLALAYDATLEGWSRALDLRDKETEGHTQRVVELTDRLARVMGVAPTELVHIRRGALLHDIGKMGIPDSILLKPGPLTSAEWEIMRQHPVYAYDLLSPVAYLRPALEIPYGHHEKWDGTGYPRGLKGVQIPLAARIFAAVDIWDALCSNRPYRAAWPEDKVRAYLQSLAGNHLDPTVVPIFLKQVDELSRMRSAHTN